MAFNPLGLDQTKNNDLSADDLKGVQELLELFANNGPVVNNLPARNRIGSRFNASSSNNNASNADNAINPSNSNHANNTNASNIAISPSIDTGIDSKSEVESMNVDPVRLETPMILPKSESSSSEQNAESNMGQSKNNSYFSRCLSPNGQFNPKYEEVIKKWKNEFTREAYKQLEMLASKKDPHAMYDLATCLLEGFGFDENGRMCVRDNKRAYELVREAAIDLRFAPAQWSLGHHYLSNDTMFGNIYHKEVHAKALKLLQEAAGKRIEHQGKVYYDGFARAQYDLYLIYTKHHKKMLSVLKMEENDDELTNFSSKQARELCKSAADLGHYGAQYEYGKSFKNQQNEEAVKYFLRAAEQGFALAEEALSFLGVLNNKRRRKVLNPNLFSKKRHENSDIDSDSEGEAVKPKDRDERSMTYEMQEKEEQITTISKKKIKKTKMVTKRNNRSPSLLSLGGKSDGSIEDNEELEDREDSRNGGFENYEGLDSPGNQEGYENRGDVDESEMHDEEWTPKQKRENGKRKKEKVIDLSDKCSDDFDLDADPTKGFSLSSHSNSKGNSNNGSKFNSNSNSNFNSNINFEMDFPVLLNKLEENNKKIKELELEQADVKGTTESLGIQLQSYLDTIKGLKNLNDPQKEIQKKLACQLRMQNSLLTAENDILTGYKKKLQIQLEKMDIYNGIMKDSLESSSQSQSQKSIIFSMAGKGSEKAAGKRAGTPPSVSSNNTNNNTNVNPNSKQSSPIFTDGPLINPISIPSASSIRHSIDANGSNAHGNGPQGTNPQGTHPNGKKRKADEMEEPNFNAGLSMQSEMTARAGQIQSEQRQEEQTDQAEQAGQASQQGSAKKQKTS